MEILNLLVFLCLGSIAISSIVVGLLHCKARGVPTWFSVVICFVPFFNIVFSLYLLDRWLFPDWYNGK